MESKSLKLKDMCIYSSAKVKLCIKGIITVNLLTDEANLHQDYLLGWLAKSEDQQGVKNILHSCSLLQLQQKCVEKLSPQEEDWRARESAILALGAISEGCAKGLLPYLADMLGMLLPKLGDARPLVRSITCWALSRYSHWLVQAAEQAIPLAKEQLQNVLKVHALRSSLVSTEAGVCEIYSLQQLPLCTAPTCVLLW